LLLTQLSHEGKQPQVLEESVTSDTTANKDDFHQGYRNRFIATPWDVFYRPALEHPKPRVLGSQTAVVTGPKGEEIHCDQYGRVKVQFFWDREGLAYDKTSCWLRVSSGWAGDRYGGIAIPRIGMEVLVTFLEAGMELTVKAGGSFVKLDAGGITVIGPVVKVNAGGSAGNGTGIGIKPPVLPGVADRDKAGSFMDQALVSTPPEKVKPKAFFVFSE